jgi:hypothetical protein
VSPKAEAAIRQGLGTKEDHERILGDERVPGDERSSGGGSERGSDMAALFDVAGTYWVVLRFRGRGVMAVEVRLQALVPKARISASETLRRLPLKRMERDARAAMAALLQDPDSSGIAAGDEITSLLEGDRQRRLVAFRAVPRRGKRGPRGYDRAWYEGVAAVIRAAEDRGEPPGTAVRQHFFTTKSTASRWIATCREMGFLDREANRSTKEG